MSDYWMAFRHYTCRFVSSHTEFLLTFPAGRTEIESAGPMDYLQTVHNLCKTYD